MEDRNALKEEQPILETDHPDRLSELELENQKLREENELLKEYRASLPLKERIYDRVPLNLKQLDIIIGILMAALIIVIAMGILDR